ncbi:MAG: bile acid:sodium symporter family protein [Verrucomicrobiales bacterium]|nr:bile acid:sodium symporter family protein [Verrucomicrobiales bacterium]
MSRLFFNLTNAFPLWVLIFSTIALFYPAAFVWFLPYIPIGLGIIMLGMGMTLTFSDFKDVLKMPRAAVIGVICQFTIMPFLGYSIARLLGLEKIDPHLAVGLILVACCPGGTASNVIAYLARANVALSVLMTVVSTFAAILLTPLLTKVLVGTMLEVSAMKLFLDTLQVVLLPVVAGLLINRFAPKVVKQVTPFSPFVSVVAIVLIVACIIGLKNEVILGSGWRLLAAPALLHISAFTVGYFAARCLRLSESASRTISIEVGMQNSGLGTYLANNNFKGTNAAVPCAISAVYHCLIGSVIAGIWRIKSPKPDEEILLGDRDGQPDCSS